jgi:hypothetical protein
MQYSRAAWGSYYMLLWGISVTHNRTYIFSLVLQSNKHASCLWEYRATSMHLQMIAPSSKKSKQYSTIPPIRGLITVACCFLIMQCQYWNRCEQT